MTISEPNPSHMNQLRQLWTAAFGDGDDFLDMFYTTAYAPHRCRCILDGDRVAAVLYWFDCTFEGRKLAYVYAVATDLGYRNQGLCRRLMEDTAAHLTEQGYAAALLLPQDPGLRQMYGKMGYLPCTTIGEFSCQAAGEPLEITELTAETYAALRKTMLPPGSVLQEGENLSYLSGFVRFFRTGNTIFALFQEHDQIICYEILGEATKAPAILRTFGARSGIFRYPGKEKDFTMYLPFVANLPTPEHFAFAFD